MANKLIWQESHPQANPMNAVFGESHESVVYLSSLDQSNEAGLQTAVQETVDKAISLFDINVLDESRYFICEWDINNSELTIVVSDDSKQVDSKHIVKYQMKGFDEKINCIKNDSEKNELKQEQAENIRYWISNYLTTHADFMQYSLIALFHNESRNKTQLL